MSETSCNTSSKYLCESQHGVVDRLQLVPDWLQDILQLLEAFWFLLKLVVAHQHTSPDMEIQWVEVRRVFGSTRIFPSKQTPAETTMCVADFALSASRGVQQSHASFQQSKFYYPACLFISGFRWKFLSSVTQLFSIWCNKKVAREITTKMSNWLLVILCKFDKIITWL